MTTPWITREQARAYLGYKRASSIDALLIESERYVQGKIRYRLINRAVRLWREDVETLLKPFPSLRQLQPTTP